MSYNQSSPQQRRKASTESYPFWFGGAASCAAVLVTHPLDLTKVRLQTSQGNSRQGMLRTIFLVVRKEGTLAIYNGLSAAILRQLTYSTVRFGAYDKFKTIAARNGKENELWTNTLCAMMAGAMGGAVGNPADVVNVRMQNDGKLPLDQRRNYKNAIDGLIRIVKEDGISALRRGIGPNVGRGMLMTAGQLVSYDTFKGLLLKTGRFKDDIRTHFTSSLMAGLVATTISSPVDVIKTRVMNSRERTQKGSLRIMADVVRAEGFLALFKGWSPAFVRLGPQTILTFVALEQLQKAYRRFKAGPSVSAGLRSEDKKLGLALKGN